MSDDRLWQGALWLALREYARLTQNQVETSVGMSRGRLSWIERGIRPSAEEEKRLCAFYADVLRPSEVSNAAAE